MNIKQAPCMARIVAPGNHMSGWLVQVLYAAPNGLFCLPDGYPSATYGPWHWVCESLMHSSFRARLFKGGFRETRFAVIRDAYLRPLPGIESPEQMENNIPAEMEPT